MDQIEEDHRKKIIERDSKIRMIEYELSDKDSEIKKKVQDKDTITRGLETEITNLKD